MKKTSNEEEFKKIRESKRNEQRWIQYEKLERLKLVSEKNKNINKNLLDKAWKKIRKENRRNKNIYKRTYRKVKEAFQDLTYEGVE